MENQNLQKSKQTIPIWIFSNTQPWIIRPFGLDSTKSLTYLQNDVLTQTMGDRGCGTALVPTIPCINTQRLLDSGYFEIWNQWLIDFN